MPSQTQHHSSYACPLLCNIKVIVKSSSPAVWVGSQFEVRVRQRPGQESSLSKLLARYCLVASAAAADTCCWCCCTEPSAGDIRITCCCGCDCGSCCCCMDLPCPVLALFPDAAPAATVLHPGADCALLAYANGLPDIPSGDTLLPVLLLGGDPPRPRACLACRAALMGLKLPDAVALAIASAAASEPSGLGDLAWYAAPAPTLPPELRTPPARPPTALPAPAAAAIASATAAALGAAWYVTVLYSSWRLTGELLAWLGAGGCARAEAGGRTADARAGATAGNIAAHRHRAHSGDEGKVGRAPTNAFGMMVVCPLLRCKPALVLADGTTLEANLWKQICASTMRQASNWQHAQSHTCGQVLLAVWPIRQSGHD